MSIQWSTQFELGHERIDAEHRIFLRLVNEFATRVDRGVGLDMLNRTLREIRKYAEFHFISEENIMEELDYPPLEEHRALHVALLESLDGWIRDMSAGKLRPQEVQQAIVDWFAAHTSQEDHKLVAHIRAIGWSNINIINPFF
jgi:hemerythrin